MIFLKNLEKFIDSYRKPYIIGEKEPPNEEETIEYLKLYKQYEATKNNLSNIGEETYNN